MHHRDREAYPESNPRAQSLTEAQIDYLSKVENYLFYNQHCDPKTLFDLYRRIWQQQSIIATGSKAESELLKSGLVVMSNHKISLAPALDRDSFNDSWVENQLMRLQPYSKIKLKLFNLDIKASLPYKVLTEINFWTGGQPYLTQKICQLVCDRQNFILRNQEASQISRLVHQYIIDDWEGGLAATHLKGLCSQLFAYSGSIRSLLISYQKIWHGQAIYGEQTLEQKYLLTIGLIKLEKDQFLVANRIYHSIFDHVWSKNQLVKINQTVKSFEHQIRLDLALESACDEVKSNLSQLFKKAVFVLVVGGIVGLGSDLIAKYNQWQQIHELQQANNLLAQKNYAAAIAAYDQLLQTSPEQSHLLWINRGYAWLGLNQHDQMLQSCTTATLINPQAPLAWNCRGEALYYLGQPQKALQAFDKAIATNPHHATIWLNKSTVFATLELYNQAIVASEQGIKLLSKSQPQKSSKKSKLAIALNQQGQSWLKLEQHQQALDAFNQSLQSVPDYLPALQGVGIASYQLNRYDSAITIFTQILERDDLTSEQQALNWLYQGLSLCKTSQISSALQAFEKVSQLTTNPQYQKLAQAGCGIR
ncbi:MAG: tetratricopeptide repeat protein [Cyanobacteria bacterium P01_E01_bin.35]